MSTSNAALAHLERGTPTPRTQLLRTRVQWKDSGYVVPRGAFPAVIQIFRIPGIWSFGDRHLFSLDQVRKRDPKREAAALRGYETRVANEAERKEAASISLAEEMEVVELTIIRDKTNEELVKLCLKGAHFDRCNRTVQNTIRHQLTNYERVLNKLHTLGYQANAGEYVTEKGYRALRRRIDALVAEAYPQFGLTRPKVDVHFGSTEW